MKEPNEAYHMINDSNYIILINKLKDNIELNDQDKVNLFLIVNSTIRELKMILAIENVTINLIKLVRSLIEKTDDELDFMMKLIVDDAKLCEEQKIFVNKLKDNLSITKSNPINKNLLLLLKYADLLYEYNNCRTEYVQTNMNEIRRSNTNYNEDNNRAKVLQITQKLNSIK
jgi:hypothetical protein